MGKLAEISLKYLTTTPPEKLSEDWSRLKKYNNNGPDMLAVLNNYGLGCAIDFSYSYIPEDIISPVKPKDYSITYSDSDLCLAA